MSKEVYGNGSIRLELYEEDDKNWLQNGPMGLWLTDQELADLVELIVGLSRDEDEMPDDDYMELGDTGMVVTEGVTIDKRTKEVLDDREEEAPTTEED